MVLALSALALLATSQPGPPRAVLAFTVPVDRGQVEGSTVRVVTVPVEAPLPSRPFVLGAELEGKWAELGKVTLTVEGQPAGPASRHGDCADTACTAEILVEVRLDEATISDEAVGVRVTVEVPKALDEDHFFGGITEVPTDQPTPEPT